MNGRIALFCLLGGLCFAASALGAGHFGWWYLSGVVITASLVPVARFGARGALAQFAQMFLMLVVIGLICTVSEGMLFFPEKKAEMMMGLIGGTFLYLAAAVVLTVLGKLLKLSADREQTVPHRSLVVAVPMVLLAAFSYLVYYEVFGAVTYLNFTKEYYPNAGQQVLALGSWFFLYQIARGLLMTLAVLPVIYTLQLRRWQAAIVIGLLIWVIGGLGPLLVPNEMMVATQRYIHIGEIFTQNFSLGVTATLLLRRRSAPAKVPAHHVATAA